MGSTPGRYAWPVPGMNDRADGPDAFMDLGTGIESDLTTVDDRTAGIEQIKTGTGYPVLVGKADDTTSYTFTQQRKVGVDKYEFTYGVSNVPAGELHLEKNDVVVGGVRINATGQVEQYGGGVWRKVPFAECVIQDSVPVGGVNFATKEVALPAGLFTVTPAIFVTTFNSIWMMGLSTGNTPTKAVVFARSYNNSNGAAGGQAGFCLHAIQMTPTAAIG